MTDDHKYVDVNFTGAYDVEVSFEVDNGPHGVALELNITDFDGHIVHTYLRREEALELANKILEVLK